MADGAKSCFQLFNPFLYDQQGYPVSGNIIHTVSLFSPILLQPSDSTSVVLPPELPGWGWRDAAYIGRHARAMYVK